ncbi:MAG: DNA topoisomerase [Clostridia bacterium]|nr:DNA topoisomerase [Clostridia bacterium]
MANETSKSYGDESIVSLKGADRVRKRPSVIFGSDGIDGCEHSFFEILSNSADEAREGYGNEIIVTHYEDNSLQVDDFGRGVPVDYNPKEKCYNWELIYCELYAGGKYNNQGGKDYELSLGMNGLGACATQYASEFMTVTSYYNNTKYTLNFRKGVNVTKAPNKLMKEPADRKKTGTTHYWRPDLAVFTDIVIPESYFHDILRRQAVANAGVKFVFRQQHGSRFETTEYLYPNGIADYVAELSHGTEFTSVQNLSADRVGRDREDKADYKLKINVAFTFTNAAPALEYYHNSSWLEHGGSPDKAVRSAFVYAVDAYLKGQNKYVKNESKIQFNDIADCLLIVTNCFSSVASYANQTKKAITNKFIQEAMTEFLRSSLEVYFIENPAEAQKIADQVLVNKRARESAEKARVSVKSKMTEKMDIKNRIDKFVDCRTNDLSRRELYIVEGDSALGSCKQARNSEFQAIMPVRGKILNCLKASDAQIFASEIITNLMRVLGCGVQIKSKAVKDLPAFRLEALRWNKVIICTDADEDGFQIRTLILAMIYRLVPDLISEGFVYIAESPLYEITCKDDTYFAYNEQEKTDILHDLGNKKVTIQRSKGLGENEPAMMSLTTMAPETRRLIRVTSDEAELTAQMFDLWLGDNLEGRKTAIAQRGYEYLDFADIS